MIKVRAQKEARNKGWYTEHVIITTILLFGFLPVYRTERIVEVEC